MVNQCEHDWITEEVIVPDFPEIAPYDFTYCTKCFKTNNPYGNWDKLMSEV